MLIYMMHYVTRNVIGSGLGSHVKTHVIVRRLNRKGHIANLCIKISRGKNTCILMMAPSERVTWHELAHPSRPCKEVCH